MTLRRERSGVAGRGLVELGGDPPCWAVSFANYCEGDDTNRARRPDLTTRADVHDLVTTFYREIMFDELLEPIFGEVAEVDWTEHIPRLIDYWCSITFRTIYKGSVTRAHRRVHDLQPVEPEHCDRWFALWVHSVDERWEGPNAERVKSYAAALMAGMAKRVFGFLWSADRCSTTHNLSSPRESRRTDAQYPRSVGPGDGARHPPGRATYACCPYAPAPQSSRNRPQHLEPPS
jgi:hemoglobin